jgi:hypothetical protein
MPTATLDELFPIERGHAALPAIAAARRPPEEHRGG